MGIGPAISRLLAQVRLHRPRPATEVTTVELFFDLVFVFTITQLTGLISHDTTPRGAGQALLILALVWWMYDGYVWLTNAVRPDAVAARLVLFGAMVAYLVLALTVPGAFGESGVAFAVAYLVVTVLHALLFATTGVYQVVRAILGIAPFNVASGLLVLVAGFVSGWPRWALWGAAVLVLLSTFALRRNRGFQVQAGHFVERHGLLMLIALGESVVAIGVGASVAPVTAPLVVALVLGLAVTIGLWWCYFDRDDERAALEMERAEETRRADLALWAFGATHYAMIFGVVLLAAGIREVILHLGAPGAGASPWLLGAGVGLFLASHAAYRRLLRIGPIGTRLIAAAVALLSSLVGLATAEAAQLGVLIAVLAAVPLVTRTSDPGQGAQPPAAAAP
jgi:low temperature requirement protein LtrA